MYLSFFILFKKNLQVLNDEIVLGPQLNIALHESFVVLFCTLSPITKH